MRSDPYQLLTTKRERRSALILECATISERTRGGRADARPWGAPLQRELFDVLDSFSPDDAIAAAEAFLARAKRTAK